MVAPLFVGRDKSIDALEHAMSTEKVIFLATQRDPKVDDPTENDIYDVGSIGSILQLLKLPDGTVKVLVEGKQRARIRQYLPNDRHFLVDLELLEEAPQV